MKRLGEEEYATGDGVEYSARFKSGFADSGDEVIVVGLDAFGLIVDKPEPQEY